MIDVIGGAYREICMSPEVSQFYGSGGRAATALASRTSVRLHTAVGPGNERDVRRLAALGGFEIRPTVSPVSATFGYIHPLQSSQIEPARGTFDRSTVVKVPGTVDVALVYGMYEAGTEVTARTVVYDPQDGVAPIPYGDAGCRATERLAILINASESLVMTGAETIEEAGRLLLGQNTASVVVIKSGARGALVFSAEEPGLVAVPAYRSHSMFGIGSGDIFAAAFAHFWGELGEAPAAAADKASRCVSHYVETRSDKLATDGELKVQRDPVAIKAGKVYLAGPFFTMAQRWLIEECKDQLLDMGLEVFSPLHDVGRGPAEIVAPADLAGLEDCDRVFAVLDGLDAGTLFELGYARKMGLPVYGYGETIDPENSKMVTGSGCHLIGDFATAMYMAAWRI
jgi:hypothetical protein